MKKFIFVLIIFLMSGIWSCHDDYFQPVKDTYMLKSAKKENDLKSDRIIVKYKDQQKIEVLKNVKDVPGELEKLIKNEKVEYAEPDQIITLDVIPNDTLYNSGSLWNMYSENSVPINKYGCKAADAWAKNQTGSSDVWVAIIDQGYQYTHEDLFQNAGVNPWEIPGNGVDDESNGYIDDVYGWNWWNGNNKVFTGDADYHGTHVAGIIGAKGGNGIGVAGVVWNVKFISAKFCGYYGGYLSDAVAAVDYIIDLKRRGLNIVAANCSWGSNERSRALQEAFSRTEQAGILMICAAGNNGSNKVIWPAAYRNKNNLSIASINLSGNLSSFSNYGKGAVDIAAPGEMIWSTICWSHPNPFFAKYDELSGTSMAAPHVTGACALYASLHPEATWQEIKKAVLENAIITPSLIGKVGTGGRLNVGSF